MSKATKTQIEKASKLAKLICDNSDWMFKYAVVDRTQTTDATNDALESMIENHRKAMVVFAQDLIETLSENEGFTADLASDEEDCFDPNDKPY